MNNNYYQNNGYGSYGFNYGFDFQKYHASENSRKLKSIYSTVALGLCIFFAVMLFMQVVIISATLVLDPESDLLTEGWYNVFLSDVPIYGVAIWTLLFFFSKLEVQKIEKKKFGIGNSLAVFPIACFITIAGSIIGNLFHNILQIIFNVEVGDVLTETANSMSLPVQIIFFVIIAPLGEELIFRKLLLDRTAKYSEGAAILFSGLTFALFHGNITQMFYAFGVGLLLAYMYVKTGSYMRCVILHGGINAVFGVLVPQLSYYLESDNKTMEMVAKIAVASEWLFALIGLVVLIVFLSCKRFQVEKSKYSLSNSAVSSAFSNAPSIIFIVLTCLLTLMNYTA